MVAGGTLLPGQHVKAAADHLLQACFLFQAGGVEQGVFEVLESLCGKGFVKRARGEFRQGGWGDGIGKPTPWKRHRQIPELVRAGLRESCILQNHWRGNASTIHREEASFFVQQQAKRHCEWGWKVVKGVQQKPHMVCAGR